MQMAEDHRETRQPAGRRVPWRWLALALVVLAPFLAAAVLIDGEPLVTGAGELTTERATRARNLVSRIRSEFVLANEPPAEFVITEDELNGLAALAGRALPRVTGRANITPFAALGALTARVPSTPFGSYINVMVEVSESSRGLGVSKVRIGSVSIPPRLALWMGRLLLDGYLGWGNGQALLNMVAGISLDADQVTVHFRPGPDFALRMAVIRDRFRLAREETIRVSDPALVGIYYRELEQLAALTGPGDRISLARYMAPLFDLAARRSRSGSAIEENRAAIMALAIVFGSPRFELFTGPVLPAGGQTEESQRSSTTLADRVDSRLHFIYSAALKLASDSGVSFALGEFKEMLDAGEGGSGFSFADLAADRAGIRFAEEATASEARAGRLQQLVAAGEGEGLFFPSLQGLVEELEEARFRQSFSGLDSPEYRAAIAGIDQRLHDLPLYR